MISSEQPDAAAVDSQRRFGGLTRLYGVTGAQRIQGAHVAIVGIGGVGSWAAEAMARSGIAQLTLIDLDHVAESNINRQVHALSTTLGQSKVQAMRERIALINPQCCVHGIEEFVEPANWPTVLPAGVDAVIDACDHVRAKTVMAQWARQGRHCFVTVGAAGGKRLAHQVDMQDLSAVTHDPLLAQVRYQLRKHHAAPTAGRSMKIMCVFSREAVAPPHTSHTLHASCAMEERVQDAPRDATLNCHGYGSSVAVTASFGLCAAGWVLQELASSVSSANNS